MPDSLTVIGKDSAELTTVRRQARVDHQAPAPGAGKQSVAHRILAAAGTLAPLVGWPA
jgi:hypothetical protein